MGRLIAVLLFIALVAGGVIYYVSAAKKDTTPMPVRTSKTSPSQNPSTTTESGNTVSMSNYAFFPDTITIKAGESVTWADQDNPSHSATADDKSFDTGVLNQGDSKSITFSKPGTYTYHCSLHPSMKGTVIVE